MCRISAFNALACPCTNTDCPQFRGCEAKFSSWKSADGAGHFISADEVLFTNGLPCLQFMADQGQAMISNGRGDDGMTELAFAKCKHLNGRCNIVKVAPELCEECKKTCMNTDTNDTTLKKSNDTADKTNTDGKA